MPAAHPVTAPDPEQLQRLYAAMGEALRPVFDDMRAWIQALHTALGGDEGIRRLTAQLEEAQRLRIEWEAGHPGLRWGDTCHCLCRRWHDPDECSTWAETWIWRDLFGDHIRIPLCPPCARAQHARETGR